MVLHSVSPLAVIEPRLRSLLPADLYATAWIDPSEGNLLKVFEHLRTLQRILHDYVPKQVLVSLPNPGEVSHEWQEGTLMFTDLAGFTPLLEGYADKGRAGAETLLSVLNTYFAEMLEIISKSGGNLLEFTGDAMLAQFSTDQRRSDTAQAVRAGLRMQRAMERFGNIETPQGMVSLKMRIGIHTGRYLTADIGTPRRMEHVLLGRPVQYTKLAEGAGQVERVNLTEAAYERVKDAFRFEPGNKPGYRLVIDDFTAKQLGEYDIAAASRRMKNILLMDRSAAGLLGGIEEAVQLVEPVASYLPMPILNLVVEAASRRQIPPDFPQPTVLFANLVGLPEALDRATPEEEQRLIAVFSHLFALINAAAESRGGVLKKVTYHLIGSDMMIYFGVPNAHTNDPVRAAGLALAIREIIKNILPPAVGGEPISLSCQIGIAQGPAFAGEIGEPRGRREFNVLGDTVNTAARLMGKASTNQILINEPVRQDLADKFKCEPLGEIALKGKSAPVPVYALVSTLDT